MAWTFTFQSLPGGTPVEHTLVWWGISEPVLSFSHATGDEARFSVIDEDAFAAAPLLVPGATGLEHRVWFSQDGVIRFVGLIVEAPRQSDGGGESRSFTVKGVGSLLARTIFHQNRTAGLFPDYVLEELYDAHVWLGYSAAGEYQDTGVQLEEILTYAAAQAALDGHTFQHSATGFPAVNILLDEQTGVTCEQAMLRMLAHSPDFVAWWDYSTTASDLPSPTFRCKSRAAMTAATLSRTEGHVTASPRYDLLTRAVAITYESVVQVDNQSRIAVEKDIYPATLGGNPTTGREVAALAVTIPLQGSRTQNLSATLACEDVNAAAAGAGDRISWWLANCPALRKEANLVEADSTYNGPGGTGGSGAEATYNGSGEYEVTVLPQTKYFWEKQANDTNLVNGGSTYTSSQEFTTGVGVDTVTLHGEPDEVVTAFLGRVEIDADDVHTTGANGYPRRLMPGSSGIAPWMNRGSEEEKFTVRAKVTDKTGEHYVDLAVNLTATNAESGTYATSVVLDTGEPVPEGLAEALYGSMSVLHWQGSFKLVEQDVSWLLALGKVLNVTDAEAALTSARLMIWRVTVDVFWGTTTVEFGDPENLGIGDLVDRLRALRQRNLATLPSVQTTGLADGGGPSNLPNVAPRAEATAKTHERASLELSTPDSNITQRVNAHVSQLASAPADTVMEFRQFTICVNGVNRQAWFLASEPV